MKLDGPAGTGRTASFRVVGMADPGLPGRVAEMFAQRGLLPCHFEMRSSAARATIEATVEVTDEHAASVIAEKLQSLVIVQHVNLCFKAQAPLPRA